MTAPAAFPPRMPPAATVLAAAGAFPLTTLAGMIATGFSVPGIDNRFALLSYGAIVLTFMGAVHWGLAMSPAAAPAAGRLGPARAWRAYTASMVPGLIAWVGLLLPAPAGAWLIVAAFGGIVAYDIRCMRTGEAPSWFMQLRLPLAVVAAGSLVVGLILVKP